jgi:hypothetical protein
VRVRSLRVHRFHEEAEAMTFVKKNPWILLVGVFVVLIAVGIATT